ncbi:MAG: hypothetical protein ACREI3_06155 [Nitrospirales bacterium]
MNLVRIEPPGDQLQTAIFIRDHSATIQRFGRTPRLSGRFRGADWWHKVVVVVIAIKVPTPPEPVLYTLWIDLHATLTSTVPFVDLAVQPNLIFQFFGDGGATMPACMIGNPLNQFPAWTSDQFGRAVEDLQAQHPTPARLWEALGHPQNRP